MSYATMIAHNLTTAATFGETFNDARNRSSLIRSATSGFESDDTTAHYLAADGLSGFAVRADGELVYVFSMARGRGDAIVSAAILAGAKRLDCFDGHLTELYARHGFTETAREPNWTPGGPDVVWMSL